MPQPGSLSKQSNPYAEALGFYFQELKMRTTILSRLDRAEARLEELWKEREELRSQLQALQDKYQSLLGMLRGIEIIGPPD